MNDSIPDKIRLKLYLAATPAAAALTVVAAGDLTDPHTYLAGAAAAASTLAGMVTVAHFVKK